ncbi:alpha/beta hydrolase family protein [Nocardia sp. NPDC052566]|uniref:alpha/beta hydrolase family protein n=1 Tax=Nocardia sp. NPDC052566 TaxID=3364330 RepID=UPI0037C871A9
MSLIDVLVPAAVIVFAVAALGFGRIVHRIAPYALAAIVIGCVAQVVVERFYWQFVPTYVLIAAVGGFVLARRRPRERRRRIIGIAARGGVGLLVLLAAIAWLVVPVPRLPKPTGPYPVGTQTFRWVDQQRPETATDSADDRRNVVVQAWYPADPSASGDGSAYIDGLGHLPRQVSALPSFLMRGYGDIATHARRAVPVNTDRARWPVVLFSPGYGAPRAFYTGLIADLASRGVIVLAVDHPYEVAVTELADGTIATPIERFLDDDPDGDRYMNGRLDTRVADLRFVLDQLERPGSLGTGLSGRLDTDHVAAIGHSFGGAAATTALATDPRLRAAADIDGTLYGTVPRQSLTKPFLLLESDHAETKHSQIYNDRIRSLLEHLGAGGYRYEILRANHFSFTDVPRYLATPGRFLLAHAIGGSRGPRETQRATNDILMAFLQQPLGGAAADVPAAARHYPDVRGGPVVR